MLVARVDDVLAFQSTLPAWGATSAISSSVPSMRFQSTLPAWGATAGVLCLIAACFTNTFARTGDALIFGYHITPFQQTFTSCLIDLRARR